MKPTVKKFKSPVNINSIKGQYTGHDLEAMTGAENYNNWLVSLVSPYLGKVVAEVGAGNGNITSLLVKRNIEQLIAFEPSSKMYTILTDNLSNESKLTLVNNTFLNTVMNYEDYFDTVLYFNVLEHIEDDKKELLGVKRCLRRDGFLCIFVPAFNWLYSEFDKSIGHFRRYGKKQLIHLLSSAGYNIEKAIYVDLAGIIPWYIFFVLMKRKLSPNNTRVYDRTIIPVMKRIEKILNIPCGKNILIIARKSN